MLSHIDGPANVKTVASRGVADNPANRFEKIYLGPDVDADGRQLRTQTEWRLIVLRGEMDFSVVHHWLTQHQDGLIHVFDIFAKIDNLGAILLLEIIRGIKVSP